MEVEILKYYKLGKYKNKDVVVFENELVKGLWLPKFIN